MPLDSTRTSDNTPTGTCAGKQSLEPLRERIDDLDRRLVGLLNERAKVVSEIGNVKRASDVPVYAPHRERAVLNRVLSANDGPLLDRTLEGIYRELMSGSFALEQPIRIGFLGPRGSFSHMSAVKHFGSSVEFENLREIGGVFTEVQRGHVTYGLVPIENSSGGGIVETLDALQTADVTIYAEVLVAIHHTLLANCEPKEIKRIYSKPEVFSQCRVWLSTQFPHAELVPTASSSRSVQIVAEQDPSEGGAAIGSMLAGDLYGLKALFEKIEDSVGNVTRFLIIGRQQAEPTGNDKTSIMFTTANKPGALVDVLGAFRDAGINLSHIDKRPSGRVNWEYSFFIDAEGHQSESRMRDAIAEAREHCLHLTVMGSYPKAGQVL
ncbi:MAG: prephenate dehydratase [Phycisphaerales bacterium]|nr:prephenate dehydratase [Phycisphaerales bacterium]